VDEPQKFLLNHQIKGGIFYLNFLSTQIKEMRAKKSKTASLVTTLE
jgi:hypothetical protein